MSKCLLAVPLAALLAAASLVATTTTTAARADDRSTAIVSMGDSYISGEAAGDYEPGTDEPGNFCHRSLRSEIHETQIDVDHVVNLACSGAATANVMLGGTPRYGEAPQAEQLAAIAQQYQVQLVVLSIGGNDVGFSDLVLDCIKAYFLLAPRCQDIWADRLPAALAAAEPKIEANLADIRSVMSDAGYADSDYQLVLQSYPSPVTNHNRYWLTKVLHGCPVRNDDAGWARTSVVSQFSATMAAAAEAQGARMLDMQHAFYGREVCAKGITRDQEWAAGVTINLREILNGLGTNIVQESLHPNRRGHHQFGSCLTGFYAMSAPAARCLRGDDGNLAPVPTSPEDVVAAKRTATLPYQHEPLPRTIRKAAAARR